MLNSSLLSEHILAQIASRSSLVHGCIHGHVISVHGSLAITAWILVNSRFEQGLAD